MLENSIWHHYFPETTIRSVLAGIYGCEASQIAGDERELYAELKRTLTKKELRTFIMKEAGVADAEIIETLGFDNEELAKSIKKSYHKIRNKVRPHLKSIPEADAASE